MSRFILVLLLAGFSSRGLAQSDPVPIAHWPMDETSGSSVSEVIQGYDGSVMNFSTITDGPWGLTDRARDLGNRDGYIMVDDNAAWNFGDEFTISAWVYPRSVPGSIVVRYNPLGNNRSISMDLDGRRLRMIVNADGTSDGADGNSARSGDGSITLNQWQLLTTTFNGGRIRMYRNGQIISDTTHSATSVTPVSTPLLLGGYTPTAAPVANLDGALGDVRIFGVELQPDEVLGLYDGVVGVEESTWSVVKALFH